MARGGLKRESLALYVALVITIVWVIAFILDVFIHGYDVPASVHAAFIATVGFLFGREFAGKGNDGKA